MNDSQLYWHNNFHFRVKKTQLAALGSSFFHYISISLSYVRNILCAITCIQSIHVVIVKLSLA